MESNGRSPGKRTWPGSVTLSTNGLPCSSSVDIGLSRSTGVRPYLLPPSRPPSIEMIEARSSVASFTVPCPASRGCCDGFDRTSSSSIAPVGITSFDCRRPKFGRGTGDGCRSPADAGRNNFSAGRGDRRRRPARGPCSWKLTPPPVESASGRRYGARRRRIERAVAHLGPIRLAPAAGGVREGSPSIVHRQLAAADAPPLAKAQVRAVGQAPSGCGSEDVDWKCSPGLAAFIGGLPIVPFALRRNPGTSSSGSQDDEGRLRADRVEREHGSLPEEGEQAPALRDVSSCQ